MGYKAQHWSAQDPSFRAKVEAALLKLGASKLDSTNARTKAMARGLVAGQIQQVLTDLCLALALAGLDIDSLCIDIKIVAIQAYLLM